MSAPEAILSKIKLLLNLTQSPNPHEAENAKAMVDTLVAKYNISAEDLKSLEEKKPLYGDDDKLFVTFGIAWEGIDIPNIKVPSREKPVEVPERTLNNGGSNLSVRKEEKEKPCKESVAPQGGTMIKDIQAYFQGLQDGKDFSFQDVLELAAEASKLKEIKM